MKKIWEMNWEVQFFRKIIKIKLLKLFLKIIKIKLLKLFLKIICICFNFNQRISNFNSFGNYNLNFERNENGIDKHEIGRCGFQNDIKRWNVY